MARFKIPKSAKGVTDELGEIGELLTATEWKRAALVASVVRLGERGRSPNTGGGIYESTVDFAKRGIHGLRKAETVQIYVQRWLDANDGEYPKLGATVTLPDLEWPPTSLDDSRYDIDDRDAITAQALADGTGASKAVDIAKNTKAMMAAIKASPAVAQAALAALPPETIAAAAVRPEVAAALAGNDEAYEAVLDADYSNSTAEAHRIRSRGSSPVSAVADALQKVMLELGATAFEGSARDMYSAVARRTIEGVIWRPGEKEAVQEKIESGMRHASDTQALLTGVSDEALANLLAGEEGDS